MNRDLFLLIANGLKEILLYKYRDKPTTCNLIRTIYRIYIPKYKPVY